MSIAHVCNSIIHACDCSPTRSTAGVHDEVNTPTQRRRDILVESVSPPRVANRARPSEKHWPAGSRLG